MSSDNRDIVNAIPLGDDEFQKLSTFIYDNFGINISQTKRVLLESRLQKRLRELKMNSFKEYLPRVIEGNDRDEVIEMINIVSTNKTDFFREKAHFNFLMDTGFAKMLERKDPKTLKIWSAACSSGEEPYSIAITLEEFKQKNNLNVRYTIDATDISTKVLETGNTGVFAADRIVDVSETIKNKYFLRSKNKVKPMVRVVKELRCAVSFSRFNLMSAYYPAVGSYDIIFCRNVLIYFDRITQERIVKKLYNCLKTGGYLFLGHSESIMGMEIPLKQVGHTMYRKVNGVKSER